MKKITSHLKKEWFLVGMLVAVLISAIVPELGKTQGYLLLDKVTGVGIALIFFLHGVSLSPQAIRLGVGNWRLHLFIQSATFVLYPLLWLLLGPVLSAIMPPALAFGFCYLFVLPGTISSSVAMTSAAKGNIAGAIFNASLSSLLGVFITPLLVQVFIGMSGASLDLTDTILAIAKLLLLPMLIGQLMRPLLSKFLEQHKNIVNKVDKCVILLIVLNAFSDSVSGGIWHDFALDTLAITLFAACIILFAMVHLIQWLARRLGFNRQDEIAAVFCGSKKTLASGVPMAKVIFGTNPMLGMILLPIMFYHQIQIIYCALLANRYAASSK